MNYIGRQGSEALPRLKYANSTGICYHTLYVIRAVNRHAL